jgi:BNR/Asp-box repeat protein
MRRWLALALLAIVAGCVPADGAASTGRPDRGAKTAEPAHPAFESPSPSLPPSPSPARPSTSPTPVNADAPAGKRLRAGAEHLVAPRPRSVAERTWEPVIATHPTDSRRVAVVFMRKGGRGATCSTNPVVRISRDAGTTWRTTASSPGRGTSRGMGLHAAIAWGAGPGGKDRLYWVNMTAPGCGSGRFSLTTSYSDDEGATWSRLRVERGTPPWVGGFPDIAVDRDPRSPNHGTVYVAYNWRGGTAHGPGFRLLASADFGKTWHRVEIGPAQLAPGARDWWRIAYRVRPAPDGSVFASWYQVDMRRRDPSNIFAKGGPGNVQRLAVVTANVRFDRRAGTFRVERPRLAARIRETAWTTAGQSAPGTAGRIRPDPIWQYGFDVDPAGRLFVAVAGYGAGRAGAPRGSIVVRRSDDGGRTWSSSILPAAPMNGRWRQSSLRPNLVAGSDAVVVTFRTLDDGRAGATMGAAAMISTDGGRTWQQPIVASPVRWVAANLGDVTNGMGLRERAERTADGGVIWAFGDGRLAGRPHVGRTAVFAVRLRLEAP